MNKILYLVLICVNAFTESESLLKPLLLYNDDDRGINYNSLDFDKNDALINENMPKVCKTDHKIRGFDFNINERYIVWSSAEYPYPLHLADFKDRLINGSEIRIQMTKKSVILSKNTQTKVAVDWVHNLVYFFKSNILTVIHATEPEFSFDLIQREDREFSKFSSGGIAVNPFDGFIVWTDYNSIDGIAVMRRCGGDGSDQQILVYKDIRIPVCIAIDFKTKTILWIDNELHSLSSIDYSGGNRKTLKQSKDLFNDCSDMDVFEGHIYWSSPKVNKILRINITGDDIQDSPVERVVTSESDIDFVRIMSPSKQLMSKNYCLNASCPHICLPNSNQNYRCICDIHSEGCAPNGSITHLPSKIPELQQNTSAISKLLDSQQPLLLFTSRKRDIRLTPLPNDNFIYYINSEFLYKLDHFISSIDFSISGNFLVWLRSDSSIYSYLSKTTLMGTPVDETKPNLINVKTMKPLFNISENSMLKTLAVDWVHNLAYFPLCDSIHSKGIFVTNLSSPENYVQIIPQTACVTKDIRIDPLESLIFWSEYNDYSSYRYQTLSPYTRLRTTAVNKSQIKRCSQDGQQSQTIVETLYVRKNSLTLDIIGKRIYWIDMQSYTANALTTATYTGADKRAITSGSNIFDDFSGMDLFGDYIYWINTEDDTIKKISTLSTSVLFAPETEVVLQSGVDIDTIKIIHTSRQPIGANKCLNNNCPDICLPSSGDRNFTCYCPPGKAWNGNACNWKSGSITTTLAPTRRTTTKPIEILDSEPKLLYIVYKEGVFLKPNIIELNTNYIDSMEMNVNSDWITEIDYNFRDNYMLWLVSSVFDGFSLYAAPIDRSKPNGLQLTNAKKLTSRPYNSKRLAFDWIHKLVYLSIPKGIEVYSVEDNILSFQVVTHDDVQGDLAVDPITGLIVWSQWAYNSINNQHTGCLFRANQDGSERQALFRSGRIPNTLTIDLNTKTIYWIDTSLFALNSMDYNGSGVKRILSDRNLFDGSFSMDVFNESIYWSNYDKNSILMTNKNGLNGSERYPMVNAYTDLEGIKVLDSSRQLDGVNRCLNSNCSQLCLPVQQHYRCVCSNGRTSLTCAEMVPSPTSKPESITQPLLDVTTPEISGVDPNHILGNISEKLNTILAIKEKNNVSHHHWLTIVMVLIAINFILIIFFVYRKKKIIAFRKYISAKFRNDREEIFLDETLCDDL